MKKIDSICIIGGGSAGWMTAGLLSKNLPKNISITLIESPNVPTVGVGEATLRTFNDFMNQCGYNESEWIDEVDGIYKAGINFVDWVEEGHKIFHPFSGIPRPDKDLTLINLFKSAYPESEYSQFTQIVTPTYDCCINKRLVPDDSNVLGYHLDALKLANFFSKKNKETSRVMHILADVEDIILDKEGYIDYLTYEGGNALIKADLFIDCTGFKNLASSKISGSEWVYKDNYILGNCAIAAPVEYKDKQSEMLPYTTAKCLDVGWMWITPSRERIGSGIVFNKDIDNIEDVKKLYDSIWPNRRLKDFNVIHFEPKYNKKSWRKNVVSIGLSSGFVEPLESSGLEFIIQSANLLLGKIRKGFYTEQDSNIYNSYLTNHYEETFDFIQLHYLNSTRKTNFWKKVRTCPLSLSLQHRIDIHKNKEFTQEYLEAFSIFGHHSWLLLFEGIGINGKYNNYLDIESCKFILNNYYKHEELFRYKNCKSNYEIFQEKILKQNFEINEIKNV